LLSLQLELLLQQLLVLLLCAFYILLRLGRCLTDGADNNENGCQDFPHEPSL
jgi:hypothetical protein